MAGVSKLTSNRPAGATPSGTVAHIAPERYRDVPYESTDEREKIEKARKTDVYSYGVLLWEIREKIGPYRGTK